MRIYLIAILIVSISFSFSRKDEYEMDGLWQAVGYGKILKIDKSKIKTYDYNNLSCTPYWGVDLMKNFKRFFNPYFIHDDTLILTLGPTKYTYFRIEKMPETCNGEPYDYSRNLNFNSFIESFKTYYAFSKERELDWDKIKKKYQPQINEEMTDLRLLSIFENIISEVDDKHTKMSWVPKKPRQQYDNLYKPKLNYDSLWVEAQNKTVKTHLKQYNNFNLNTLIWGITNDNIGYLQINDMNMYSRYNVSNKLVDQSNWNKFDSKWGKTSDFESDHYKTRSKLMNRILKDFEQTDGVVVDFRFQEGGYGFNALGLLSFFSDSSITVYSKKVKSNDGFTQAHPVIIESQPNALTKKMVLLTSRATLSGGDIFTLSTMSLPHITRIGNNTSGHFSSFCGKVLPNGWTFNMSSQVCTGPDGNNYEVVGIPPHIQTDTVSSAISFYKSILKSEEDITMKRAVQFLKN